MTTPCHKSLDVADLANWKILYHAVEQVHSPALFLDRDGVVIENVDYLSDPDRVKLIPGIRETIRSFRARGYVIVVVTNQSGVGRGYFGLDAYLKVEARIRALLGTEEPDAVYACPFYAPGVAPFDCDHEWRKPQPGMLKAAAADLSLDLAASVMVGDSLTDIEAGLSAGVSCVFHVLTGHGHVQRSAVLKLEQRYSVVPGSDSKIVTIDSIADLQAREL